MLRYYILIGVALFMTGIFSFLFNSERSIISMLFTTIAMAIPAAIGFLFIDYSLTVNKKHHLMKYYYALAIATYLSYLPIAQAITFIEFIGYPLMIIFSISTIAIIVAFFKFAFSPRSEEIGDLNHAMHVIADEYQRSKEKQQPWEEQIYELFEDKFKVWKAKREKQTA